MLDLEFGRRPEGDPVHCAITRIAREGKEREFEAALKRFIARSMNHHGTTGAHLLHPTVNSRKREYGILRSFHSRQDMKDFYASEMFAQWQDEVAELVEGEPDYKQLHGLEAFFRRGGQASPPARWKMAVVTWIGVFPVVVFWSRMLGPYFTTWHPVLVTGVVVLASVITLTWGVMPMLTKLFSSWLHSQS